MKLENVVIQTIESANDKNHEVAFAVAISTKDLDEIRKDGVPKNYPYHIYISANFPLTSSASEIIGEKCQDQHINNENTIVDVEFTRLNSFIEEGSMEYAINSKGNCIIKKVSRFGNNKHVLWFIFKIYMQYLESSKDPFFCRIQLCDERNPSIKIPRNAEIHLQKNENLKPISILIYLEMPTSVLNQAKNFAFQCDLPLKSVISNTSINIGGPSMILFFNGIRILQVPHVDDESIDVYAKRIMDSRGFFSIYAFELFFQAVRIVIREFYSKSLYEESIKYGTFDEKTKEYFDLTLFKFVLKKIFVAYKLYVINASYYAGHPPQDLTCSVELVVHLLHMFLKAVDLPVGCMSQRTFNFQRLIVPEDMRITTLRSRITAKTKKSPADSVDYKKYLIPFVESKIVDKKFLNCNFNQYLMKELPKDVINILDAIYGKCNHLFPSDCKKLQCDYSKPKKYIGLKTHIATCPRTCNFCRRFTNLDKLVAMFEQMKFK